MRKLQEGYLYIAIAIIFPLLLQLGESVQRFLSGELHKLPSRNARSPKLSRPPEPSFNNQTPNEAPKRTGVAPARKKKNPKKERKRKKGWRSYGVRCSPFCSLHQEGMVRCGGKGSQEPRYLTNVRPGLLPHSPLRVSFVGLGVGYVSLKLLCACGVLRSFRGNSGRVRDVGVW